jgi:hypothetical protein
MIYAVPAFVMRRGVPHTASMRQKSAVLVALVPAPARGRRVTAAQIRRYQEAAHEQARAQARFLWVSLSGAIALMAALQLLLAH